MKTRYFSLIYGIAFLLTGIAGFIPGLLGHVHADAPDLRVEHGYGYLLGLFPINVLHNIVHLLIGIAGLFCFSSYIAARNFGRGVFIFYGASHNTWLSTWRQYTIWVGTHLWP